ncbi:MAG: type IX secretion system membrane protein PorP/SprF [Flavobacteriaceae bacterium]|nr:type IX secretion system membrane protein PorP/SprF [Muriicola sp.]NNL38967.1 type IX secretion system membrane protein PorP/SprF [Flavobacteriaceae bacterium]
MRLRTWKLCGSILGLLLLGSISLHAQLEPQYTQYMYNIGSFNPAYSATVENPDITGLYRAQWIDIDGAPRTLRFGTNIPWSNERNGMGINVISDQLGPTTQTFFNAGYSFQINVSQYTKLSFGVNAGGALLNVDFTKGSFEETEPLLVNQVFNEFYPTVGAGMFLYDDDWYLGASIPNFITGSVSEEVASLINDKIQFTAVGGYVFDLSDQLKFKPAFLAHLVQGLPLQFNLSTNFLINDVFTAGAGYTVNNTVSGLAGFQISSAVFVGYSYDYNTNSLGQYNQGSHEMILKFYLGAGDGSNREKPDKRKGKPKQIDTPRFF